MIDEKRPTQLLPIRFVGRCPEMAVRSAMPSLFRFLLVLLVLAAIGGAAMFYLANYIEPNSRDMSERVPAEKLAP
jgi:lipopolysaccharide export LptBFGC system permease protein LptF